MILFLALSAGFGLFILPRVTRWASKLPVSQNVTTLAIVVLLVYGVAAELLGGMAAITGTFIAGLMFARTPEKKQIETNLHALSYAFFVPVFFISIGLSVNLSSMELHTVWMILGISVVAILGKIIGSGGGALIAKFTRREALLIGIGMVSRGEVGLIIAKIGLDSGYLSAEIFSSIIGMILITTLVTPPLLRFVFNAKQSALSPQPVGAVESNSNKETR